MERSLWSSWAVTSEARRFFFAGDTASFEPTADTGGKVTVPKNTGDSAVPDTAANTDRTDAPDHRPDPDVGDGKCGCGGVGGADLSGWLVGVLLLGARRRRSR